MNDRSDEDIKQDLADLLRPPTDGDLARERSFRISVMREGAERLERRAHALILEAHSLRQLADKVEERK